MKIYAWAPVELNRPEGAGHSDPLMDDRIHKAVEQTLLTNGYKKGEINHADFYVRFQYEVQQKIETDEIQTGFGFGTGGYGWFGGLGIGTGSDIRSYDQGVLILDIIDPEIEKVLWRGKGTYDVDEYRKPEEKTRIINELVKKVPAQFPPV
ncbi:MAG: DUF4136 domain-containing protein [Deltaproteobacteria bacterium]|nr:DUF4136 domain-containing protein [Deltaproteobacteria bacterium]